MALRSEGYPTQGARTTGLKSVVRNRVKRQRWEVEEKRGIFYAVLYAQNGQEIARSCPKTARAAAEALLPAASAASMALAERAAPAVSADGDGDGGKRDDDYLVCSAYEARLRDGRHPKHDNVAQFTHANGKHYFAIVGASGELVLRSEGYPSEDARRVGLKAVLRNLGKRNRYKLEERRGLHYTVLYAQNGQEIARSCPKKERSLAEGIMPGLSAASLALGAAAASGASTEDASAADPVERAPTNDLDPEEASSDKLAGAGLGLAAAASIGANEVPEGTATPEPMQAPVPEPPAEKQDDYLKCEAYAGRKVNDKVNRVALFKHQNGQYYFAFYDDENRVRLRSEGFETARGRDQELSGALRYQHDEDHWERIIVGGRHINILRDDTGREVGRSCISEEPVPFLLAPLAAAGVGAAAVAAAAPIVKPAVAPTPTPAVAPVVVTPAPKIAPAAPVVADRGGVGWWLWALLGLLAIGLALWLLRGCFGCGDAATSLDEAPVSAASTPAPATPAPPAVAPVEVAPAEVASVPPPPPPAEPIAPPPTTPPALSSGGNGAACGPIVADAPESSYGVPLLTGANYGGTAGDIQDFLAGGESTASFPLADIDFMAPGNDYAVEPCTVANVDRLAAVMRNNPNARLTVSAATQRQCESLKRLLTYRGVDASRMEIVPDADPRLIVTRE